MATLTSIVNNIIQKVNNLTSSKVNKVTSTDNAVVRFNGTTGEVQNSGVIVDDNDNVGIGTSSPSFKLDVTGGTGNGIRYTNGTIGSILGISGASGQIGTTTNHNLELLVGYTSKATIDTSGNVGIGLPTPKARLDVYTLGISGGLPVATGNAKDPNVMARFSGGSVCMDFGVESSGHQWIQCRSLTDYSVKYGLHLQPNGGNLLIGTTTDNGVDRLQVNGSISSGDIQLIENGDLNDYKTRTQVLGTYPSAYVSNIPINDHGYLEVIVYRANEWVMQRFTTLGTSGMTTGRIFVRCFISGTTWSAWVEK